VIHDEKTLEHLEKVREFARKMGLSEQLEHQLSFLGNGRCWGSDSQCDLRTDFAPRSFTFAHHILPRASKSGKRTFVFNGGLIYQGPDPSLLYTSHKSINSKEFCQHTGVEPVIK
jgi:hypothetical protein